MSNRANIQTNEKHLDNTFVNVEPLVSLRCPYCNGKAELKDSAIIYNGKSYGNVWVCENYPQCDSFVGVHKATNLPLGTLANNELRQLRRKCHDLFDKLWKSKKMNRQEAYKQLGELMGIEDPHIGAFTVEQCQKYIASN